MAEDFMLNREAWDATSDEYQAQHHEQLEQYPQAWGIWSLPESELQLLGDVDQRDVLEYGCGGAQWSIALARRGARCTGLDNSARQLTHAQAAIDRYSVSVKLVHGYAEHTPFADSSFDIVFCDHGAMSFVDPERTVPEVSRILRRGGIFAFSVEHPIHAITWSDSLDAPSRTLHRSYFALGRQETMTDGGVTYVRPIAAYIALLIANGFNVENLLEPRPPHRATTTYQNFASPEWAGEFPAELMIRARRL